MNTPVRAFAVGWIALVAGGAITGAKADPADHPPAPPVALIIDLGRTQLPSGAAPDKQKPMDVAGLPVLIATGPRTDVGIAAHHSMTLYPDLSLDSRGSLSRMRFAGFLTGDAPATERGNGQATLHYMHGWLDLSATPGLSAEGPEAGVRLGTALDNRVAISDPSGWGLVAASHTGQRNATMVDGAAGKYGSASLDITRRLASSSSVGVGYSYGWSSPESAAVSADRQVSVSANFDFVADVDCSAQYRQSLAAGTQALGLGMDWDLKSQGFGDTRIKADVSLQRSDPEADAATLDSAADLSLAMKF